MKIAIVVDHYHRDLKGYLALIDHLLKHKNYEIILINFYHLYELYLVDPDLIILQNTRPENVLISKDLKKLNKKIIVIDNEGVPFGWTKGEDHIKQFIKNIVNSLDIIDAYVVWSKYIKSLLNENKIDTKKIYILGNQRFELFKQKFNYIYTNRKTTKKTIVINTNTPNSNPNYTTKRRDQSDIKKKLYYDTENKNEILRKYLKNNQTIFENYLKLIRNIINDFKDHKIILNIHPFESKKLYKKLYGESKNVIILNNNFLLPQLYKNYDFIIQYNSTTCAETLLGGKKSISVNFVDPNNIQNKFYNNLSLKFYDYDTLKIFIKNKEISNKEIYKIKKEELEILSYLYHNESCDTLQLISELIYKETENHKKPKINTFKKYFYFLKYFLFFSYDKLKIKVLIPRLIKLIIIFILNSKKFYMLKVKFLDNYKKKHIKLVEIQKYLKKLNLKEFSQYQVFYAKPKILKILFRNLVCIRINKNH
ncbi:hypothetical protein IDG96_02465 [Pelagibacterales bacterium SAG-MED16]|nr:hypothetical protein [Pelagibacterales bacterium SAG-MED16]|tara:strand:+ start:21170 stop:22609 length:1440 start_codon:yes stop_codon:yes gene_type:complete